MIGSRGIGEQYSFWKLYQRKKIIIPQIQRDYVQGRDNSHVKDSREKFVDELVDSLIFENRSMALNFIYGCFVDGSFIPIDGQQRLTTLFLLHLFVFSKCARVGDFITKSAINFSYETRFTTDRFLRELIDAAKNPNFSLTKRSIEDSSWFVYRWNNDPSIVSCLVMIDELNHAFTEKQAKEWDTYRERLISEECPIHFMLLELDRDQFGKPNQLYIKMNSRGKQLTDFENFKASLFEYINPLKSEKKIMAKINELVDKDWQDLIWNEGVSDSDLEKREMGSDEFYRCVLHWIIINRLSCWNLQNENNGQWIKPDAVNIGTVFFETYKKLAEEQKKGLFDECVEDIYYAFEMILSILKSKNAFSDTVKKFFSYSWDRNSGFVCNLSEYKARVFLFAITVYGRIKITNPDAFSFNPIDFVNWFRIINNLVNNTEIDDYKIFCDICNGFAKYNLLADIENNPDAIRGLSGFSSRQVNEEIFKQKVINRNKNWEQCIKEAETDDYFQGEILFALSLSGLQDAHLSSTVDPIIFREKWKKIVEIKELAKKDNSNGQLFHRALLTFGDYSKPAPGSKGNDGVVSFFQYNETHHNYDWRGMLRPNIDEEAMTISDSTGAIVFKQLLENYTGNSINSFAEERINSISSIEHCKLIFQCESDPLKAELLFYLIKWPSLFEYCKNYYYIWRDRFQDEWDRYLLMKNSKRNAFLEYKIYCASLESKGIDCISGNNPYWNDEGRRSYIKHKEDRIEYKKKFFTDLSGSVLKNEDGTEIITVCDLLKYLSSRAD